MTRRAAATLAAALACAPPMAQATPPDQIIVGDELFGISAGHVFVLRQSWDNLGLYNSDMRNVALVAIDRRTAKEQIWPVIRTHRLPDYDNDPDGLAIKTDQLAVPGAVDPFGKLAEMGGYPTEGQIAFGPGDLPPAPNVGSNAETIWGFTLEDGTRFEPDMAALRMGVGQSLDQFAEAMGDYPRFGPLSASDLLSGRDYAEARCTYTDRSVLDDSAADPPAHLVLVTCPPLSLSGFDGSEDVSAAIWKIVPPEPAP